MVVLSMNPKAQLDASAIEEVILAIPILHQKTMDSALQMMAFVLKLMNLQVWKVLNPSAKPWIPFAEFVGRDAIVLFCSYMYPAGA